MIWNLGREGTDQYAVLDTPGWDPVEHPRTVVLHLCLDEIKVPGLIVSNAHIKPPVTPSITGSVGWPEVTIH